MGHKADAHALMRSFNYEKRRLALIWAAKWTSCKKCNANRGEPCINLNKRAQGKEEPTVNPHDERIDWELLLEKLKAKGYH